MSNNEVPFGEWLRAQLAERGMSQSAFARAMGTSVATPNRWINEGREPNATNIPLIARALDLSVDEVMIAAGVMPESEARVGPRARLLNILTWLPDQEVETVLAFAEHRADAARRSMRLRKRDTNSPAVADGDSEMPGQGSWFK